MKSPAPASAPALHARSVGNRGTGQVTGGDTGDRRTEEQFPELRTKQENPGLPLVWPETRRSALLTGTSLAAGQPCAGLSRA